MNNEHMSRRSAGCLVTAVVLILFWAAVVFAVVAVMSIMSLRSEAATPPPIAPEYIEIQEGPESAAQKIYHIDMTESEGELLRTILALEAQDEPFEGKKAVVEVIFNRVQSPEWPDTVYGVLSQKGQFATWKYRNDPYNTPGESEDDAIAEVLAETRTVLPDTGYVFFSTRRRGWMHDCVKIEHHWFGR